MLYTQISEMIIKLMKRQKELNLFKFLETFDLTAQSAEYFKKDINFSIGQNLSQRKLVDLGKALARIISAGFVLNIAEKGFRKDLIDNCLTNLKQDISVLINSFNFNNEVSAIEDYQENSSWFQFV